jgi:DNA-binding MarR family transcriptional regulator
MNAMEHYKKEKQRDNLNRFLKLLEQHGKLTFPDLAEKLGVSRVTLSSYIKILMKQQKIMQTKDEKDLRVEWYSVRPEKAKIVESQIKQYEAVKFIEDLVEPIHAYETSRDGTMAVSAFASIPNTDPRAMNLFFKIVAYWTSRYTERVPKLSEGQKVALVIMMSGKKEGANNE